MKTITFLGDSITQAHWETNPPSYSVAYNETYPANVAQLLNVGAVTYSTFSPFAYANQAEAAKRVITGSDYTCWAAGIGGQKTSDMLARFDIDVLGHNTDFLVLLAGVNDIANGITPSEAIANVQLIINKCKANSIIPILAKITPWTRGTTQNKDDADTFNSLLVSLGVSNNVRVVDTFTPLAKTDGSRNIKDEYNADGIHMTPAGYNALASLFTSSVFEQLPYDLDVILIDNLFDLDVILNISSGLPIYIGSQQVQKMYIGSQEVVHLYKGTTQIF